jgi:hypothetical protein
MRVFTRMRELLETHREILNKLDYLERKEIEHDERIVLIFEFLRQLENSKKQEQDQKNRKRVGYKRKDEN